MTELDARLQKWWRPARVGPVEMLMHVRRALITALTALVLGSILLPLPALATVMHDHSLPGVSLADLVAGGEIESGNGLLSFSKFTATPSGDAPVDLDRYRVVALEDGIRLITPLSASGDDSRAALRLSYDVLADDGFSITDVSMGFHATAEGEGAKARARKNILDMDHELLGTLRVVKRGPDGHGRRFDEVELASPQNALWIEDVIVARTRGHTYDSDKDHWDHDDEDYHTYDPDKDHWDHGDKDYHDKYCPKHDKRLARVFKVDQRFMVVPEPSSLALIGIGLVALGAGRRPRRARRR